MVGARKMIDESSIVHVLRYIVLDRRYTASRITLRLVAFQPIGKHGEGAWGEDNLLIGKTK